MKDELKGIAAEEVVGLRPKLYSILYKRVVYYELNEFGEEEEVKHTSNSSFKKVIYMNDKMTAKGIKESVKRAHLRHSQYVDALKTLSTYNVQQNLLKSKKHTIYSISIKKVGLNAFDDKRWICQDGIHTLAHGHWRTKSNENSE